MSLLRWLIGGVIGAAIGAAVWAAAAIFGGFEASIIAIGVGFLAGLGVRFSDSESDGFGPGAVAALCAIVGILGAKYGTVQYYIADAMPTAAEMAYSDDDCIGSLAGDLMTDEQWEEYAEVPFDAPLGEQYPADVLAEAQAQWDRGDDAWREEYRTSQEQINAANLEVFEEWMEKEGFLMSFGLLDILFFGAAVVVAFGVGANASED